METKLDLAAAEEQLKRWLQRSQSDLLNVLLAAPSFREVEAAINNGPEAGVQLIFTGRPTFTDAKVDDATVSYATSIELERITLTHLEELRYHGEGIYEFKGAIYTYNAPEEQFPHWREYSYSNYSVSVNVYGVSYIYRVGGGRGTQRRE